MENSKMKISKKDIDRKKKQYSDLLIAGPDDLIEQCTKTSKEQIENIVKFLQRYYYTDEHDEEYYEKYPEARQEEIPKDRNIFK